jgi:hypothetical protein
MSILQIKKLQSGAFEHIDSIDGTFFLGRFNFKQEFNQAFLVEAYGAKRREYLIGEIEVYDYLGNVEKFTNFTDLINRLVDLSYTGIDTNAVTLALTASGFGSFSNSLTTEDAIPDAGVFNYTNILGLQVKTTWSNLKAKLKTYFDALYQTILVSGTNIKTINGTSILGSGNLVVSGGSSADYLLYKKKWKNFRLNSFLQWRAPIYSTLIYDNELFGTVGTGTTPGTTLYTSYAFDTVPDGYLIDSIELEINYKLEGSVAANLQIYIERSEVAASSITNSVSNRVNLVNEIVTLTAGSANLKFAKNLTVATHSLPTLAKALTHIAVRETTATDVYYSLGFNFIYKKA